MSAILPLLTIREMWTEIRTLAAYEEVKRFPIAVLMITKLSDDASRRLDAENYLQNELKNQGIVFNRVTKETFELSKGCAKIFDFTITPTIHFLLKGKLVESPYRLAAVNSIVNRIKEHIEYKARIFQIQNLNGFSSFTASRLAVLMFYDQTVPKMASLLNGLSISFELVEFGIVNSANHTINNGHIVPPILGFPSIIVFSESKLVTKTPITVQVLYQYLETRRTFLNDNTFKLDYVTLRDDIEAAEDNINNATKFNPVASNQNKIEISSLAEVIYVNDDKSSIEFSISNRSRSNSISKFDTGTENEPVLITQGFPTSDESLDPKKVNNSTPGAISRSPSGLGINKINETKYLGLSVLEKSLAVNLSINSIDSTAGTTGTISRRASFSPAITPSSISRRPSNTDLHSYNSLDVNGTTGKENSWLGSGLNSLDSNSVHSDVTRTVSRRGSIILGVNPATISRTPSTADLKSNSSVNVNASTSGKEFQGSNGFLGSSLGIKLLDSNGSSGSFSSQSPSRRPSFVPETVREASGLVNSSEESKESGDLAQSEEESRLQYKSHILGQSTEKERVLRSSSMFSKNPIQESRTPSIYNRIDSTHTDASNSSTPEHGPGKIILGGRFVELNEESDASLGSSISSAVWPNSKKWSESTAGDPHEDGKKPAIRANSVKVKQSVHSSNSSTNSSKVGEDKSTARRAVSVKTNKPVESFEQYLDLGRRQTVADRPSTASKHSSEVHQTSRTKTNDTKDSKRYNLIPSNISPFNGAMAGIKTSEPDSPPSLPKLPTVVRKKSARQRSDETEKLSTQIAIKK